MEGEFLGYCILLHIKRKIVDTFSTCLDDFYSLKDRKVQFKRLDIAS